MYICSSSSIRTPIYIENPPVTLNLMWMKSRHILNSHFQSSMNSFSSSWEEQAFAKDAAGPHGGSIWPPRCYSCSFCKREFRSAQALGGHMNIHRRDRAKLKHSFSLHSKLLHQHHNKQSQFCTLDSNPDPNSNPGFGASPSVISTHVSPFNSSIVQEHQKEIPSSSPPSCSDSDSEPVTLGISDSKNRCEKNTREEETTIFLSRDDYIETNLSVGLNLVLSQNIPMDSAGDDAVSYKRYKTSVPSSQFFLKHSSMEDLDLELRLGDPPKVK